MPLNIFDGSSWNPLKKIQIHDGSTWNESKAAYIWTGTEWKSLLDLKPKNTELPTLSLQGEVFYYAAQETVSVSTGVWENSPTSYKYQWQKAPYSSSGYNWSNILDKTSNTLFLDEDEWVSGNTLKYVGYVVRCKVTATNAVGDNEDPVYTIPSPVIAPQKLSTLTATVIENGVVKIDWLKPIGANDFYIQYQGPEVSFTETQSLGNVNTLTIDTGTAGGTLGILVNPKNNSNVSGQTITGYGKNASVSDLKPNKPSVTTTMVSNSTGGTFSWSLNLIQPTEWIIYNNGELYTSSYFTGNPSQTSYSINEIGVGGTTFGAFTITINGTAPRFTETSWSSSPPLSINYPEVPMPVNQVAPSVSGNGRVFTTTNGTWSNQSSIYSYIHEWYSNGTTIPWGIGSTLDLGSSTDYDNTTITSSVQVLTTDLRLTTKTYSSNSASAQAAGYTIPNLVGQQNPSSTSQYNIAQGSRITTSSVSEDGKVSYQSPAAGTVVPASPIPTITVYRYQYVAMEWFCTESYAGGGIGNCSYTKPGYNNSASGSGYSRNCVLGYDFPSCQSTAAPVGSWGPCTQYNNGTDYGYDCTGTTKMTWSRPIYGYREQYYLDGVAQGTYRNCTGSPTYGDKVYQGTIYWTFNSVDCGYVATPPATPPVTTTWYCTQAVQGATSCTFSTSSSNVSGSGSGYNVNCSTVDYPACPIAATPPATPPTPPATPPTPPATPPTPPATPPTPPATPPTPPATPPTPPATPPTPPATPPVKYKCLSPEALIFTANGLVKAKDISVGDILTTINRDYMDVESIYSNKKSYALPENVSLTETKVISVDLKKSTLIGFNGLGKNYSVTQPLFIKTKDGIEYRNAGEIEIGQQLVNMELDGSISYITINSIEIDDKESVVYDVRTSPEPWFIVNSLVAIA